jgi:hypothetical protein
MSYLTPSSTGKLDRNEGIQTGQVLQNVTADLVRKKKKKKLNNIWRKIKHVDS